MWALPTFVITPTLGRAMAHMAIDACGIRKISFDGHDIEAVVRDQAARDGRSGAIEFRGAVAGFTQKHDTGIAETIEVLSEGINIRRVRKIERVRAQLVHRTAQEFGLGTTAEGG